MDSNDKDRSYILAYYEEKGSLDPTSIECHQFYLGSRNAPKRKMEGKKHRAFLDRIAEEKAAGRQFMLGLVIRKGEKCTHSTEDDPATLREEHEEEMGYMKDGLESLHESISSLVCDAENWRDELQSIESEACSLT